MFFGPEARCSMPFEALELYQGFSVALFFILPDCCFLNVRGAHSGPEYEKGSRRGMEILVFGNTDC